MMVIGLFGMFGFKYQLGEYAEKHILAMIVVIELFHLPGNNYHHIFVMPFLGF
jgi:hypothetical protein